MASASVGGDDGALQLNIMPLLDVFSILIVFLLMSFSTDPISYDVNAGLELPQSDTLTSLDEIPTITVTTSEILVQDKKVASIFAGDVPPEDRKQGAVYPVYVELKKLAEANKALRRRRSAVRLTKDQTDALTMEMDQKHRFKLMKRIMLAAQQAEFITFKLMVAKQMN